MPDTSVILVPLSEAAFPTWIERQSLGYSHDKVRAGNWQAEGALEKAQHELAQLLPQGVRTPYHFIYEARRRGDGCIVGHVWLHYDPHARDRSAYLYDLNVSGNERGQGYGETILLAGEAKVKDMGAQVVKLHVFGYNDRAQKLYQKLGYVVTNLNMTKTL